MNDDQDLSRELQRMVDVPDRADWEDVRRQAESAEPGSKDGRRRFWRGRPLAMAGGVAGVAALATILTVLLIRSPDAAQRSTTAPSKFLATVPDTEVPATVRAELKDALPNSTAIVFSQYVNGKAVRIWRAIDARGQYLTALERVGSPAEQIASGDPSDPAGGAFTPNCIFDSSSLPPDPPGSPRRVVVPEIFGLSIDDGIARLRDAGFTDIRRPDSGRELYATDPLPGRSTFVTAQVRLHALDGVAGISVYRDRKESLTDPIVCGILWAGRRGASDLLVYGEAPAAATHVDLVLGDRRRSREDVENGFFAIERELCSETLDAITGRDANGAELGKVAVSNTGFSEALKPTVYCPRPLRPVLPADMVSALTDPALDRPLDIPSLDAVPEKIDVARGRVAARTAELQSYGAVQIVVAPTGDDGELCMVVQDSAGGAGTNCWERETALQGRAALWYQQSRQGDPVVLAGVVPDGVSEVVVNYPPDGARGAIGPAVTISNNVWYAVVPSGASQFQIGIGDPSSDALGALFTLSPSGVT